MLVGEVRCATTGFGSSWKLSGGSIRSSGVTKVSKKRQVLRAGVEAVGGRVPLVAGVSEFTTARAIDYARDAEKIGIDALMLLPAMVYVPTPAELEAHFRAVAAGMNSVKNK